MRKRSLSGNTWLWLAYSLAAVVVTIQRLALGRKADGYTVYENYLIFKNSFAHLVDGLNPYAAYPAEQWDLYKYSPAFSLFMAPFSVLPDAAGLLLWNLVNALPLLAAVLSLPLDENKRRFVAWFILLELVTSMQNSQSNGLTAALILWTWVALERGNNWRAGAWTAAGAFLKIFGGFAVLPSLLYPKPWRFWIRSAAWIVLLAVAPLLVVSPAQLVQVYRWWVELLLSDHAASIGLSVSGWLEAWFGWMPSKTLVTGAGLVLLLLSIGLAARRMVRHPDPRFSAYLRALAWASVLIWVVIFNHKAESPTFVIAICGVAIWYVVDPNPKLWKKIVLWLSFALVSLSPTDLVPPVVRKTLLEPYVWKAVPVIVVWILLTLELPGWLPVAQAQRQHDH